MHTDFLTDPQLKETEVGTDLVEKGGGRQILSVFVVLHPEARVLGELPPIQLPKHLNQLGELFEFAGLPVAETLVVPVKVLEVDVGFLVSAAGKPVYFSLYF